MSIDRLQLEPDDKVLIIGAGTGLDLPFLKAQKSITAVDITHAMVERLKHKAKHLQLPVDAQVMDGHNLAFENDSFDAIILHLIVAVIPDPVRCLQEAERVLKPGGRITILDKFIPAGSSPGLLRKVANTLANFLFSAINRDIDKLLGKTALLKKDLISLKASYCIISASKENY